MKPRVRIVIRRAGPPVNFGWTLQWQTDAMPAPAFEIFPTRAIARNQARILREGGRS